MLPTFRWQRAGGNHLAHLDPGGSVDQERRKEGRITLTRPQRGNLSILLDGRQIPVHGVVDVSPTGVGVLVSEAIAVGTSLEVAYKNEVVAIHLPGVTVWSSQHPTGQEGGGEK